jgi:hypothetical protein
MWYVVIAPILLLGEIFPIYLHWSEVYSTIIYNATMLSWFVSKAFEWRIMDYEHTVVAYLTYLRQILLP